MLSRRLPLPPPPPLLMEPRKKPSAELAFRRFFFFKYQFPFVLRQPPIRAEVCRVWRKAGIVFRAPGGKVVHLLFFLIRFPAILQESQRLQLLPSAVNGGPPCLRTYMLIIWQGEKKKQNKNSKKKLQPSLTKVFLPVSIPSFKSHQTSLLSSEGFRINLCIQPFMFLDFLLKNTSCISET